MPACYGPAMDTLDNLLGPAEKAVIAQAGAFARDHVAPFAQAWEDEKRLPLETLQRACAEGLCDIELATSLGGKGMGFAVKLLAIEAMARHDMGFTFSWVNHLNALARIARDAKGDTSQLIAEMRAGQRIGCAALTEPGAGSDFGAIKTRAEKSGDGWILNGAKAWITNAAVAGVAVCYAQTDPAQGWRGIAAFLVRAERPGFVREAPFRLHGGHAIGAGGFRLENYRCAGDDLLQPPGAGFKSALQGINGARTYVAAMCNAMLGEAIRVAVRYGRQRQIFGKPILDHQGQRWILADAATELEAARLLTYRAARIIHEGGDAELAAAFAKKFAVGVAQRHLAACIQFMGAEGLKTIYPLSRHLACAKLAAYTDGSTEIQNERIGRALPELFGGA